MGTKAFGDTSYYPSYRRGGTSSQSNSKWTCYIIIAIVVLLLGGACFYCLMSSSERRVSHDSGSVDPTYHPSPVVYNTPVVRHPVVYNTPVVHLNDGPRATSRLVRETHVPSQPGKTTVVKTHKVTPVNGPVIGRHGQPIAPGHTETTHYATKPERYYNPATGR